VVFIATGVNYPDALAAGPAAAKLGGPLLLTAPSDLPSAVASEVRALHPAKIYIVGGTAAVSDGVRAQLQTAVPTATITRLAGTDRYDTGRRVVAAAFTGPVPGAYVATAANYPDALSAAAAAGAQNEPVILVNGSASSLDKPTSDLIGSLGLTYVNIAGGTSAVSTGVESALRAKLMAINNLPYAQISRFAGTDRFQTSALIAADAFVTDDTVYVATGYQFPDALAGSALAGALGHPLLTTQSGCIPANVIAEIERLGATKLKLVGGVNALGTGVESLTAC
jgi:putative cell wall-binding protein